MAAGIVVVAVTVSALILIPRLSRQRRFVVGIATSHLEQALDRGASASVHTSARAMGTAAREITVVLDQADRLQADDETLAVRLRELPSPAVSSTSGTAGRDAPDAVLREAGPGTTVREIVAIDPYHLVVDQRGGPGS